MGTPSHTQPSPLPSLQQFGELAHVVREDVAGPETLEVLVSVERPHAGHLAAPLGAELDTESLESSDSAPDEDPGTWRAGHSFSYQRGHEKPLYRGSR